MTPSKTRIFVTVAETHTRTAINKLRQYLSLLTLKKDITLVIACNISLLF
jgi:hypothetical protein